MLYELKLNIYGESAKTKATTRLRDALGITLGAATDAVNAGLAVTLDELPEVLSQIQTALWDDGKWDNRVDYTLSLQPKAQEPFVPVRLEREQLHAATFQRLQAAERRAEQLAGELARQRQPVREAA